MTWSHVKAHISGAVALAAVTLSGGAAQAVEEAEYKVIKKEGDFEVREYKPRVVAETYVESDFEEASNKAFNRLFRYISGDNKGSKKIEMTAPVTQETSGTGQGEQIAMTAPVTQETSGSSYRVTFILPATYTIENAPEPTSPDVKLKAEPAFHAASIMYTGRWEKELYEKKLGQLQQWMTTSSLTATGSPVWARYNSPMSLPLFRRNEVLIPIKE